MKNPFFLLALAGIMVFACGNKNTGEPRVGKPAIQVKVDSVGNRFLRLDIQTINAEAAYVNVIGQHLTAPTAEQVKAEGRSLPTGLQIWDGLEPETDYSVYACAEGSDGTLSSVVSLSVKTWAGDLYSWEEARTDVPFFADLVLTYGAAGRNPQYWTKERIAPMVTWTDPETGVEQWLFDAFLALEGRIDGGWAPGYPHTYMMGVKDWDNKSIGMTAANQSDAGAFLDYWFRDGNGFCALEEAVADAESRIGAAPTKRKVIVMMPDIPVHQRYNVATTPTAWWGSVGGRTLDFSNAEDRRQAYYWFIDETRRRFYLAGFQHIELGGFYIMSEELPSGRSGIGGNGGDYENGVMLDGWEVRTKAWDDVFPAVSDYIHQYHESVCWIPYRSAAGYRYWKEFGIDYAWMQPNYYWDTFGVNPISSFFQQIATYQLGMELEFDDMMMKNPVDRSASEYTKTSSGGVTVTETYEDYRSRWKGYVNGMLNSGVYGVKPIALYQDTDSFNHLRTSSQADERDLFNEICRLVANDPLKARNR